MRTLSRITNAMAAVAAMLAIGATAMTIPPTPPQGAPTAAEVLARLYGRAAYQINQDLARSLRSIGGAISADERGVLTGNSFRAARAAQVSLALRLRIDRLAGLSGPVIRNAAEHSVEIGAHQGQLEVQRLGLIAPGVEFRLGEFDHRAVELAAGDIAARLGRAANDYAVHAEKVFRSIAFAPGFGTDVKVTEAIAGALVTGDFAQVRRDVRAVIGAAAGTDAETSYRKLGNRQIEVGGWTGSIRDYTEMLVLTRTREATVTSRHTRLTSNGIGLVQITGRRSLNFCTRFLGMVFAIAAEYATVDGKTYPLLSSIARDGRASPPFHPRCSKGTAAYIPQLVSSARAAAFDIAEQGYKRALAAGTLFDDLPATERRRKSA